MKTSFCSIAYKFRPATEIPDIIRDVKAAGYDGVEVWWPHVEKKSDAELAEVKAAAGGARLAMPMLSPYLGNFNLAMTNYDEMIARTRASAPVAVKLGIPLLRAFVGWTCECSSLTASEEYWRFNLKGFREMAAIAADHGLTIAVETHGQTLVDSVQGVRRLLEEGDGRLRVNLQLDDMAANSKLPDGVAVYEALKRWVVHMHVHLTAPDSTEAAEWQRIFAAMRRADFKGYISMEHCSGNGEPGDALTAGRQMLDGLTEVDP
jgi:3-dehydroshikimate dehydratase